MKYLGFIIVLLTFTSGPAFAEGYFENQPLSNLRVIEVNIQDKTARIAAPGQDPVVVGIGDTIGQNAGTVFKISKVFVKVRTDQTTTKIPVARGASMEGNRIVFH